MTPRLAATQYFDASEADKTADDAIWAITTAERALRQTRALIDDGGVDVY